MGKLQSSTFEQLLPNFNPISLHHALHPAVPWLPMAPFSTSSSMASPICRGTGSTTKGQRVAKAMRSPKSRSSTLFSSRTSGLLAVRPQAKRGGQKRGFGGRLRRPMFLEQDSTQNLMELNPPTRSEPKPRTHLCAFGAKALALLALCPGLQWPHTALQR